MNLFFKNRVKLKEIIVLISKLEIVYYIKNKKKKECILINAIDCFDYTDKVNNIINQEILKIVDNEDLIEFYFIEEDFVIIPEELFSNELRDNYLKMITPIYNYHLVLDSKIEINKSRVVYSFFKDIEFFIEQRFKNFKINHIGFKTLNSIVYKNSKEEINCIFHKNYAEIILIKNKEIIHYNLVSFNNLNELLKELITKIEFYKLSIQTLQLKLIQSNKDHKKYFKTYFKNIKEEKNIF